MVILSRIINLIYWTVDTLWDGEAYTLESDTGDLIDIEIGYLHIGSSMFTGNWTSCGQSVSLDTCIWSIYNKIYRLE